MELSRSKAGARQTSEKAKHDTKPWIRRLGRFGYMAQGLVYGLIGVLAFMAAIGAGGKTTDTKGMLQSLPNMPFGQVLLWIIGIGLIGYCIWGIVKCFSDPEHRGSNAKGIFIRIGYLISAVIYGSIAFTAIKTALNGGSSGGSSEQSMSAQLLSKPYGQWIIGGIGVIIIGYGVYEFISGYKEKFMTKFKTSEMSMHERKIARNSGKMGLIARGIVLAIVGFFFVQTAVTSDPSQNKGLDGALSELAKQPYGQWLLGAVALGLILYGVYGIIRGRYEHMSYGGK
ncbi:DUF1206 domain-containing protein [Bacillus sp. FJAT-42376]|uniref:DUF1206 domain-containing protein n=1 Tax=Bacillus sp. FJAT-42376 TaxID=2014076 RepID=UPI000F4F2428|nr:DUF1206 domain-containing protein [Bacillus sp. FJAT-42376]AZB41945.1 DUF1206 domain-containing protein [Bacillus sp. FJAT-42376]